MSEAFTWGWTFTAAAQTLELTSLGCTEASVFTAPREGELYYRRSDGWWTTRHFFKDEKRQIDGMGISKVRGPG